MNPVVNDNIEEEGECADCTDGEVAKYSGGECCCVEVGKLSLFTSDL